MLRIEKTVLPSPEQWEIIIEGMRNPKNSWHLMDSKKVITNPEAVEAYDDCPDLGYDIGENDHKLMMGLAKGGSVHAKYRRMIPVYITVTSNHVWWAEMDTYKVGTVRNSCSKMHKIDVKHFVLEDFSHEGLDEVPEAMTVMEEVIVTLEYLRKMFNQTKEKKYWRAMIELLPIGFNIKATMMLNYEVLHNIYHSRKNHKMLEWHTFCDWIKTLPYSELITMEE